MAVFVAHLVPVIGLDRHTINSDYYCLSALPINSGISSVISGGVPVISSVSDVIAGILGVSTGIVPVFLMFQI